MALSVERPDEALPKALNSFIETLERRVKQSKLGDGTLTIKANGGGSYEVELVIRGNTAYEVDESSDEPTIRQISGRRPANEITQDVMDEYFDRVIPSVYADDTVAEISFDLTLPDDAV